MSYLVTNWHVVTGRRTDNHQPLDPRGAIPDAVVILHNKQGKLGAWTPKTERLLDEAGNPRWQEHPAHANGQADIVALPLTDVEGVELVSYDPWNPGPDTLLGTAGPLSIIGFPFGRTGGGGLGIWVQGFVATEPELDFDGLPCFLIDSRTRSGQSGSPVVNYSGGGMIPMADGGSAVFTGPVERFVGVYSGRISAESDLGFVWKAAAVQAAVDNVACIEVGA